MFTNTKRDYKLTYVASPMDAAQKMIMRHVDNALLIDPADSTVIEKTISIREPWPWNDRLSRTYRHSARDHPDYS